MLPNCQSIEEDDKTNLHNDSNIPRILYFNEYSQFKLLINEHSKNGNNEIFYSKYFLTSNNSIYILKDTSQNEVIQNIANETIEKDIKNLLSYDYKNIFNQSSIETKKSVKNEYFADYKILKYNLMYPEKYSTNKGTILVLKFDLNDKEDLFILDKNTLYNSFNCFLDKNEGGENDIFKNDISFFLEVKKIVKSIQVRLENLKEKGNKILNDEIFVKVLSSNIGIIISQNPKNQTLNLEAMKMNFNSIVKQKFILKSILVTFNISLSIDNEILNVEKNLLINDSDNYEKKSDSAKDNITGCGSSNNYNSSKKSGSEKDPQDNSIKQYPFRKMSTLTVSGNYDFLSESDYINDNFEKKNSIDLSYKSLKISKKFHNSFLDSKSRKKSYQRDKYKDFTYLLNKTFLCKKDTFSNILFNKYQDEYKSTCNLKILIEFLKIKLNKSFEELTISKFFNCFYRISSLSLKIPFFNTDGRIIEKTLTPTLKEMKLVIKSSKLIKKLKENYSEKISISSTSSEKEISFNIDGFEINILENDSIIKITYDEKKPYYLNDSLNDKLEQLMNISKYIRKIHIKKSVDINKSYMSVEWNFINGNNIFTSSFTSYYLFNSNLLGVLSEIKENEFCFFLNSIVEGINNKNILDYSNIIYENYNNITNFINNSNL